MYPYTKFAISHNGIVREIEAKCYGISIDGTVWFHDEVTNKTEPCQGQLMMWKMKWEMADVKVMFEMAQSLPDIAELWAIKR